MRCRWGTRDCHLALALLIICVAFINIKHVIVSVDLGPRITVAATLNTLTLAVFRGQEYSRKVTSDQHHSVVICPMLSEPGIGLGGEYLCHSNNGSRSKSFLTLFTTMIYRKTKMQAFNRTLSLWPLLGPHVKLVLYLTPSGEREDEESYAPNLKVLATRACELGWDVLVAPLCNEYNYPVVSSMFLKSQQISESTWYGYANGDILFADNLMWTLRFLEKQNNTGVDFVVGRRSNVVMPDNMTFSSLEEIRILGQGEFKHRRDAQDYFFVRKGTFPWAKIPPFVVGRIGYDNWLVWYCLVHDISIVDASLTILAVHQSLGGVQQDHLSDDRGAHYNKEITGIWNYNFSETTCTPLLTKNGKRHGAKNMILMKRQFPLEDSCGGYIQEVTVADMELKNLMIA